MSRSFPKDGQTQPDRGAPAGRNREGTDGCPRETAIGRVKVAQGNEGWNKKEGKGDKEPGFRSTAWLLPSLESAAIRD